MPYYKYLKNVGLALVLVSVIIVSDVIAQRFNPQTRNFSTAGDYSSVIETKIRSGKVATSDLIVDYHPRLWMRGY